MSQLSQSRAFPSPEATTSAILGASSAGWSPVRSARRPDGSSPVRDSLSSNYAESDAGSNTKGTPQMPTHRANIAVLRSHGLVSNSIFKSGNTSPNHSQASPQVSKSPYQDRSRSNDSKAGMGLGISPSSPVKAAIRSLSSSSNGSISDLENEELPAQRSNLFKPASPRKSQGFKKLQKASYVSNSPFRRQGDDQDRPLDLPNNAWAVSSTSSAIRSSDSFEEEKPTTIEGVPRTPERTPQRTATAHNSGDPDLGTPTSLGTPRGNRSTPLESPTKSGGLLVSNRLHGPRLMDGSSAQSSPLSSPTRRERRKTVTFDEVLEVQEFDRESSFDGHSLQSGSSLASSLNNIGIDDQTGTPTEEDMWLRGSANKVIEKLMVVNGSPESASSAFSTPELEESHRRALSREQGTDMVESSSVDSREMSSMDEPRSPPPGEVSFEHEHADKSFNTAPDASYYHDSIYVDQESDLSGGNLSAYGALHRVDSLVDELLEGDLLRNEKEVQPTGELQGGSPPRRRGGARTKLGEQESRKPLPVVPTSHADQQSSKIELSLPVWSPFMGMDMASDAPLPERTVSADETKEVEAALPVVSSPISSPAAKPRAATRPHISRDAVLQRVAREKKLQEEQAGAKAASLETKDESSVHKQAKSQSTILMRRSEGAALMKRSTSVEAVQPDAMPALPTPAPLFSKPVASVDLESPLERLSAEITAEQEQAIKTNLSQQRERKASDTESTRRQNQWFSDDASIQHLLVEDNKSSSGSGRLSPLIAAGGSLPLTPAQQAEQIIARRRSKNGKTSNGTKVSKTLSEGDEAIAEEVEEEKKRIIQAFTDDNNDAELREEELLKNKHLLDASLKSAMDNGFEMGLEREISRIYRQGEQKYRINDRGVFSSAQDKVNHSPRAGDVDSGKAWKKLRRPSDMNEYAKEMKEYRENENPKKAAGKVFVLVDSFTPSSSLPIPSKATRFYCVLDNGLHIVKTATTALRSSSTPSKIGQEFELIQHKNLEFNLTLVVQRDSHLQEPVPQDSPTSTRKISPSFSRGMGKLFSSPKKKSTFASSSTNASMASSMTLNVEPMLAYINKEGAFGRSDVVFEKVASHCLGRCYTVDLPVRGVNDPAPSLSPSMNRNSSVDFSSNLGKTRGTLRLKLFYLPPMPSVARNLLPQNLGECIRGMEAARWHSSETWMEGTLTQLGGDCASWRRRPVKAQGAHLIGFNEITKKPTIKIDLGKAVSIEQSRDPLNKAAGGYAMDDEELDGSYQVERSFRVTFKDGEKIYFFADTDEEMKKWITGLKKVVGNKEIPANCVWATVAMEMIKAAKEKSEAITASSSNLALSSKRVPVKIDGASTAKPPASASTSSTATPSHRQPRVPVPPALDTVKESTPTPEQTPVKRRPVSALQMPRQISNGKLNLERPVTVYVDGQS
jgi:hypothetical protein